MMIPTHEFQQQQAFMMCIPQAMGTQPQTNATKFEHVLLLEIFSTTRSAGADLRVLEDDSASSLFPVLAGTDNDNLQKSVHKDTGQIQDRRLRIVVAMIRQSVLAPCVSLRWVPTWAMTADGLTKVTDGGMLRAFLGAVNYAAVAATSLAKARAVAASRRKTLPTCVAVASLLPRASGAVVNSLVPAGRKYAAQCLGADPEEEGLGPVTVLLVIVAVALLLYGLTCCACGCGLGFLWSHRHSLRLGSQPPRAPAPLPVLVPAPAPAPPPLAVARPEPEEEAMPRAPPQPKPVRRRAPAIAKPKGPPVVLPAPLLAPPAAPPLAPPPPPVPGAAPPPIHAAIVCPKCLGGMTLKHAHKGGQFYGCDRFPACCGSRKPSGAL